MELISDLAPGDYDGTSRFTVQEQQMRRQRRYGVMEVK